MRPALLPFAPLLTAAALAQAPEPTDAPDKTPSDFARFVRVGDGGHFDTAITTYRKGDAELKLFGAVHVADAACYEALNDRFTQCDALLYELVAPADYRPTKARETGFNPLALVQHGLKNSMALTFQLDVIDYSPANFVHADMTPEEFKQSMEERGETLLTIFADMMLQGMRLQGEMQEKQEKSDAPRTPDVDIVKAFRSGEGRHALRMAFAPQLEQIELLAAGGKPGGGGTLIEGRNEKCLDVLLRELAAGKKKLGIYYGAAHLPHMERRLVDDLGFTKVGHEWLVAWDCTKRKDVKYDRALVKLRQRCRDELEALARAARDHRLAAGSDAAVPTPAELAVEREGVVPYRGSTQDPWGHAYVIEKRPTGSRWQARSFGQDGVASTDDDLVVPEPRRGGLLGF